MIKVESFFVAHAQEKKETVPGKFFILYFIQFLISFLKLIILEKEIFPIPFVKRYEVRPSI